MIQWELVKSSTNARARGMEDMHDNGFDWYLYVNNRTLIDGIWEEKENINQDDSQISGFSFWLDGDS